MYLYELKKIKSIAILWFWKEGKSTLNFLLRLWIPESEITILDKNVIKLEKNNINKISGNNYLDNLWVYNLIFKSPWISPYNDKILPYREKLTSQTEVFFDNYEGKTIWITATKGKSTVSTLLYETLKNIDYKVKLVGNIGKPVFDEIDLLDPQDYNYVIYELSSYMLETCKPHCNIWVLWNIYTCHLDWHNDSFEVYEQAKLNITKNSDNVIISNEFSKYGQNIDNISYFWPESKYNYNKDYFFKDDQELFSSKDVLLLWDHNKKNISCVVAVLDIIVEKYNHWSVWIFSKMINSLENTLKTFSWLPHRMEKIAEYNWISFIDDWISTTPESTIEAIKTFWSNINTLLLWGWDYWFTKDSYKLLLNAITEYNIKNIVLFPDTGLDIFNIERWSKEDWEEFNLNINKLDLSVIYTKSMNTAIKFAYNNTWEWNICLMSCAAPSYSLWTGYEEKWQQFLQYIIQNKKENS
jgi:UDP-N-acetylmuramoylalanine--D-glutamate ligase